MTSHRSCTPVRDDSLRGRHARSGEDRLSSVASDERYRASGHAVTARGVLRNGSEDFARLITQEMGKPLKQARDELEKCAALCDWYASNGPRLIADEPTTVENDKAYVSYLHLSLLGLIRLRAGRFVCNHRSKYRIPWRNIMINRTTR